MNRPAGLIDLASERVGGVALEANDEFFAPKESLLKVGPPVAIDGRFTEHGFWMDGWETRRRREPGHDWCVVRLGVPGMIRAVTVDTTHFKGNHPEAGALDATAADPSSGERWVEILPTSPLQGHTENQFEIGRSDRFTHVRLRIYPDGGVARLRVWGEARPDWATLRKAGKPIDLIAIGNGGLPLGCSDEFFSEPLHLIMPGPPADMSDGWQTRRRRGPGHDWVVFRLGHPGVIEAIEVDTTHFKGNFPESCSLEACDRVPGAGTVWRDLLTRTKLAAHRVHRFTREITAHPPITHVRFNLYPDGGVARLRLLGHPAEGR